MPGSCGHRADADVGWTAVNRTAARGGAGKAPLDADILSEGARCGNDARFDFHLLGFAVQLVNQVVNHRNHRRNVADDQLVRTVIGQDVSARRKELFQCVLHRLRLWRS